jgi:uncharacterized spore protein YtfJ
MDVDRVLNEARDAMTVRRVFGEPYVRDGITVIPAASVTGGGGGGTGQDQEGRSGGGGGFGVVARPAGAFVIREGRLTWQPAVDVTRVILGGQIVVLALVLVLGRVLRTRAKRKR